MPKRPIEEELEPDFSDPSDDSNDEPEDGSDEPSPTDEWFERHDIRVDARQSLVRLDKFLMDRLSNRTRNRVQNAIRAGSVLVDDREVKPNYKVKPGNQISIILPRDPQESLDVLPQNIPLTIVYEDNDVLIIDKPYNMAVHPGVGIPNGTLVNAVAWHLREAAGKLPVKEGNDQQRAGIVHRIDKDTTGLMVVAKNDYAMSHLANQFFHHTIERRYWALVWGDPEADSGTVEGHIGRNPNERKLFMVFPEGEDGKHAVTHWRVLERFYYTTLVECRLETGRTHQIRVHMKYIGHTLFGDPRYGGNRVLKGTLHSRYKLFAEGLLQVCPRQALHAKVLGFVHPVTGEHLRFESELPEDMRTVIDGWRAYVHARKAEL
ncbi:MAG: RluA family pseudouridine synthase [Saprospiraceae bacterium]|nr:RluA family pseudouridine synthase [Saprospiraceae bacterium]